MSQVTVTSLKDATEASARAVKGICPVWINFDGNGTIATRDSLGVSGITDNGTGDYTVSFSNNFDNAHYAVVNGSGDTGADTSVGNYSPKAHNVGSAQGTFVSANGSAVNRDYIMLAYFGDLA